MTVLTRWPDNSPDTVALRTDDSAEIATELERVGVRYEQWPLVDLPADASNDDVLAAYKPQVDALVADGGYNVVDVAQLHPSDEPGWEETAAGARSKFLAEHTHSEDEIRFFVEGAGIFYLHLDDSVFAVQCEAGDLISVPALTKHWFDMGTRPDFTALRFFVDPDGWVGNFTADEIALGFPTFDELTATR